MALDYIQPAVQVRKVAKLLELVTIRVKRGEIPETLESSREIEETGLEISPPSVITVSRGDCFATGKTVRDEVSNRNGDPIERTTTRRLATILARAIRRTLDKAAVKSTQDTSQRPSKPEVP